MNCRSLIRRNASARAFTLIELLIVIAIIAILALIAIPNFLEAQTRSKIARVQADMRTLGIAIEAYNVDCNIPPPGQDDYNLDWGVPTLEESNSLAQNHLTTPVAYITTLPLDPFHEKTGDTANRRIYTYMMFDAGDTSDYLTDFRLGYSWGLQTKGPSRANPYSAYGMHSILAKMDGILCVYDPSNGTISSGVIIRTNKGHFNGVRTH
ncbi:MAG: prepilin-type N-terminal cleavage/methylation domain-containing protein [Candidatus Sumerlaeota bacterium]|nr:prepilin-type N-terminal cleavage/methylation domain-containing protein [Candidatus Sumerlaeota bacterium]